MAVATCPHCSSPFSVGADFVPHKSRCPNCKKLMGDTPARRGRDEEDEEEEPRRAFPPIHWMAALAIAFVVVVLNSSACASSNYMAVAAAGAQIGGWSAFVYLAARTVDRILGK